MKTIQFSVIKPGYDVLVVGAGTAGCSFLNNVNSGLNVLCVDSKKFPRFKACSGILVESGKDFFGHEKIPNEIFANKAALNIKYLDIDNGLEVFSKKAFFNTWRKKLDSWIFSSNKNESAEFISECRLEDFYYTSDGNYIVALCEQDGVVKSVVCKYLIGCDGANSTVRKKISKTNPKYYIGMQEIINQKFEDSAYFIFDSSITDFYGWIIPKGNKLEVGCALSPYKAKEKFDLFKEKMKKRFNIVGNGIIESAIISRPQKFSDIVLGEKNVLLCGEAAGLISPSSAEGISYSLWSGKFAAKALNESAKKDPFESYTSKCEILLDRLYQKLKKSELISDKEKRKKLFEN